MAVRPLKFSIIILNYNGMTYLPECLRRIREQHRGGSSEIIVVNNLSTDGSREYLLGQEDVRLIDPGCNTGFSRGQNLGLLASRGEFALCLNFDCFLEPGFLDAVSQIFAAKPEVGAVSGKLKKLRDRGKTDLIDSTGISFLRCAPADRGEWSTDGPEWDEPGPIFGASGAAACYRRAALEEARFGDEFFDEDMFIYCEDVDLAWRLNLKGWTAWYAPAAVAYHERGSTRKDSAQENRNYFVKGFRNRLLGLFKNLRREEDMRRHRRELFHQELRFILGFSLKGFSSTLIMLAAVFEAAAMIVFRRRLRDKRRFIQGGRKDGPFRLELDSSGSTLLWMFSRVASRVAAWALPLKPAPLRPMGGMARRTRASLIVLNYNGKALLPGCLAAIEAQGFQDFELIVVDNDSTDGSTDLIEEFKSRSGLRMKTFCLDENVGFSAGNNAGLRHAEGDYIALLNNDAEPEPRWLEELVNALDSNPEVGIGASKMLIHGTRTIDSAGVGFSTLLKGFNVGEGTRDTDAGGQGHVFGACGGAVIYRRKMLMEIGSLDDDFFLIHEDVDLSFRAQLAGWKVLYIPSAVVHHKVRSSIGRMSDKAVYYTLRNSEYVRIKNVPLGVFLGFLPQFIAGMMTEFLYFAVKHRRPVLYLKAKLDVLRALPKLLVKRVSVMRKKRVSDRYLRGLMTPILQKDFLRSKTEKFLHG